MQIFLVFAPCVCVQDLTPWLLNFQSSGLLLVQVTPSWGSLTPTPRPHPSLGSFSIAQAESFSFSCREEYYQEGRVGRPGGITAPGGVAGRGGLSMTPPPLQPMPRPADAFITLTLSKSLGSGVC